MDMSETIVAKSDQLNAVDLLAGPRVVTITKVTRGDADQPVNIVTEEFGEGRPYKPCLSMRRVMVAAWGKDATTYAGRRLVLFNDPTVRWGGQETGGVRISAMSHLAHRLTISLTLTRGKKAPFTVDPLPDTPDTITPAQLKQLATLLPKAGYENDEAGRADWIAFASSTIGRQINGSKELTSAEAAIVIEALEGAK